MHKYVCVYYMCRPIGMYAYTYTDIMYMKTFIKNQNQAIGSRTGLQLQTRYNLNKLNKVIFCYWKLVYRPMVDCLHRGVYGTPHHMRCDCESGRSYVHPTRSLGERKAVHEEVSSSISVDLML